MTGANKPDPAAPPVIDMAALAGRCDVVLITLDTLRFDAAQLCFERGELPVLARHLPPAGWQRRHSPASFTFAAHQAFFAGFLPTPAQPGPHPRLFALAFPGSETIDARTWVFDDCSHLPQGFAHAGYRTSCIGGVGFFNPATPLGRVLPAMFEEAFWQPDFAVTVPHSAEAQIAVACRLLGDDDPRHRFLFINISALHQPNCHYLPGAVEDTLDSHRAALRHVDAALRPLFASLRARGPALVIVTSDHGTSYGDDGWHGHRHAHPTVMTVPYSHFLLP